MAALKIQEALAGQPHAAGEDLHALAAALYPLCRSITGDGVRETLAHISSWIPLAITEVPTGTPVLDWVVPKEWNIRDAYIKDPSGARVVDFQRCNLHVMSYSTPVHGKFSGSELQAHLFSLPEHPERIPYRTSYYEENWGFCVTGEQRAALTGDRYEVCIDATLSDGHLTYGEYFHEGASEEEVLLSCHICHPSLANDNLSGIAVASALARTLAGLDTRYSYRFLFAPGTIGAITWLARNPEAVRRIRHGLVLTCLGDAGPFHYKRSRRGDAEIDRAAAHVLQHAPSAGGVLDFSPYGYDERQYCSPGYNLAAGCLMRSVWGTFSEYHTSADNLEFIQPAALAESLQVCGTVLDVLEDNATFRNLNPYGEPQLGRRGLYRATGGAHPAREISARLWVLNLSDGTNSLLDIAERSKLPFAEIGAAARLLRASGLLELVSRERCDAAGFGRDEESV